MKLNGKNRIISEDDIELSGSSLSEKFESQQQEIDELKSNVKWIYKYGGVGKGGSGGGGSTTAFSVYATLDGVQLSGNSIILKEPGVYNLFVKINNPNNGQFNVTYTYSSTDKTGNAQKQQSTQILNIENRYTLNVNITLNNNDTLTVDVTDGNDNKQVSCSYVTTPYQFSFTSISDGDNPNQYGEEVFVNTAKQNGLNLNLNYSISVNVQSITYKYQFNGETTEGTIEDNFGSIKFKVDPDFLVPENAGYYNAIIEITVTPTNQDPVTLKYNKYINLIPEDLYLLVLPETGHIYKQHTESPEEYLPGYITFNYRVYCGANQNRSYNVLAYVNGEQIYEKTVVERSYESLKLPTNNAGENTIEFKIGTSYSAVYYFYVSEIENTINWFDEQWVQNYYRLGDNTNTFNGGAGVMGITQSVNSSSISINNINIPNISGQDALNTHIAIGLQYNAINNTDNPIIQLYGQTSSTPIVQIKQSKITIKGVDYEVYIKKQDDADISEVSNFHLLQIFSKYTKSIGNDLYYQISIYIDGRLEAEAGNFSTSSLNVSRIEICPSNCFINCLDVDYIIKNPSISEQQFGDYQVYKFFSKYKESILHESINPTLINLLSGFNVDNNDRVATNSTTINSIASLIDTPSLLFTCEYNGDEEDFWKKLEQSYEESDVGSDFSFNVKLSWSRGGTVLKEIVVPADMKGAQFMAILQGSSTKLNKSKNFFLELQNTDEDSKDSYLFSPNFKNGDSSTFLPEKGFNLKSDVVDSSHSNNTACGKFVNTVCKKFNTNETGIYKDYVRNCLEGFPILLYIEVVTSIDKVGTKAHNFYYLGIYNFNLGRESYYNLGYRDLSVFYNNQKSTGKLVDSGDVFTFFSVPIDDDKNKKGIGVAEIQGGTSYFDFSQYDKSILFKLANDNDQTYMFGDIVYGSESTLAQVQDKIANLVKQIARSGGYIFNYLKKRFGPYSDAYTAVNEDGSSKNQVPDFTTQYSRSIEQSGNVYTPKEKIDINSITTGELRQLVVPDIDNGSVNSLDFQSLSEYYTICMTLGLVDSVMKNMNIKTWDMTTWVLAFYDMDTCLGIDNAGNDTSYFAFSDYWYGKKSTEGNIDEPQPVNIYRDFYTKVEGNSEAGFDTPSSYIFAIAKYAKLLLNGSADIQYLSEYPQQLYAKWRSGTSNSTTNEGILCNADNFMEKFFSNNIGKIDPLLVTFNYRYKYFKLDGIGWDNYNYKKFHGTRINKVRDWLNGRLHILDDYFNLNKQSVNAITYLDENDTWQTLKNGNTTISDITYDSQTYNLQGNPDIQILHDIFSDDTSSSGLQTSEHVSLLIKCPENSPLQIYNANKSVWMNYILGGNNYQKIEFKPTGQQAVHFGGSQAWTYLSSIDWVSQSGPISITSKNLENITGTSGKFSGISLSIPSLKDLKLNSNTYSGLLSLKSSINYPNLKSIDISGSNLSMTLDDLSIDYLNISNIQNSQAEITITNCNQLKDNFYYGSLVLQSLTLSGNKQIGDINLDGNKISKLDLSCSTAGKTISISNDISVSSISLTGFENIKINGCPNLQSVVIKQGNYSQVKNISITNCSNKDLKIQTGEIQVENTVVDFSEITTIETVNLRYSSGITKLILPNNVKLTESACQGLNSLQSISGTNIQIAGNYIFYNCTKYNMRDQNGQYTDFNVQTNDISYLFYMNNTSKVITLEDAKHFITQCISDERKATITNMYGMFYGNQGINYDIEQFKSDLNGESKNYIDFSKFKSNELNVNWMFANTNVKCYNKNMLNFNVKTLNMYAFIDPMPTTDDSSVYVTIDSLENIIDKVKMLFGTYSNTRRKFIFLNESGDKETGEIKLKDFFNPNEKHPIKLQQLDRFYTDADQTVDFTGTFTEDWKSLTTLRDFMWKSNQKYKGIENLLYDLPSLQTIGLIFLRSSIDQRVDLFNFINWENFTQKGLTQKGLIDYNRIEHDVNFDFDKKITLENYNKLCNLFIKSNIVNLVDIFRNCNIEGVTDEFTFGTSTTVNNTIENICGLFYNCKLINNGREYPIPISNTFFKNLSNIKDVYSTFSYCSFSNPIPFNFFNKRQVSSSINSKVYVDNNGEKVDATLTIYEYRPDMIEFGYVFYNSSFTATNRHFEYTGQIPKNNVYCETTGRNDYTKYYTKHSIVNDDNTVTYKYTEHTLEQPYEITDCENVEGYHISEISPTTKDSYTNPGLDTKKSSEDFDITNCLCIPPDFFYGINRTQPVNCNYALSCQSGGELTGIIPEHIFCNNTNVSVSHTFRKQIIVPRKIKQFKNNDKTVNVYSNFPSNYTNYTNLDYAFDIYPIIPINDKTENNFVFIILKDSIGKNTTSMMHAFDVFHTENRYIHSQTTGKLDSYINYMGYIQGDTVITGFDMEYFKKLYIDSLFYGWLGFVCYGNLFNSNFILSENKINNKENIVFMPASSITSAGDSEISVNIKFPLANNEINYFYKAYSYNNMIKTGQISSSDSKKWYSYAGFVIQ